MTTTPVLCMDAVSKTYGSDGATTAALTNVSLELAEGETVALIGPSGSGKSTLLRCLNALEGIDSGTITFQGKDIHTDIKSQALRSQVGMVFQDFNLFPHLTLEENVTIGQRLVRGADKKAARARSRELLERVGILARADHHPGQVSGGQQQRAAIARALALDPKVLLFDEPTSALDPETVGEVLRVMSDLAHSGTTMMVATHEMSFAREAATRVCMMEDGAIVEQSDNPASFFRDPQNPRTRTFLARVLS
jgi:ABC-type polar amino acid transport system ATPase subunit